MKLSTVRQGLFMSRNKTGRITKRIIAVCSFVSLTMSQATWAGWEIHWQDTFDGTGVDWSKWTAQTQANFNGEIQCYTDDDTSSDKNYDVSDGTLKIIARKMSVGCPGLGGASKSWTSGRLNSKDKAEFLYGRIEARIRFDNLDGGTWPAFWMLENRINQQPIGSDDDNVNWPSAGAGEIDVWEWFSNQGNTYITNFFNSGGGCPNQTPVLYGYPGGAADVLDWHNYGLEWDENNIRFFVDDTTVVTTSITSCPQYKEAMFVLLNVAIGGNLGGPVDGDLTLATMEVDYVSHCKATDANSATSCGESTPLAVDDDGDGVSNSNDLCPGNPDGETVDSTGCIYIEPTPTPVETPTATLTSNSSSGGGSNSVLMLTFLFGLLSSQRLRSRATAHEP
ncbi:MAG: beta-glucanase (GH16 family) [Lentisphaeria bacterium]|jgi:beta-glucanase (GH16 family)